LNIQNGYTSGFPTNQHSISFGYNPPNDPTDLIATSYSPNFNQIYEVRAVRENGLWTLFIDGQPYGSIEDPGGYQSFQKILLLTVGSVFVDDITILVSP
jgi:hypothetical protein